MSDDTFFLELYKYHTHDFHPGERTKGLVNKSLINKHPSGTRAGAEITIILHHLNSKQIAPHKKVENTTVERNFRIKALLVVATARRGNLLH